MFAKIAKLPHGGDRGNQYTGGKTEISALSTQDEAAKLLGISIDTGQFGKRVVEHGVPELVTAVERGDIAVSTAAEIATQANHKKRGERRPGRVGQDVATPEPSR